MTGRTISTNEVMALKRYMEDIGITDPWQRARLLIALMERFDLHVPVGS